jgi:hypothetical protein
MRKIILIALISIFITHVALADIVNMNISVNGTSNLNITVNSDDTFARQLINQTQTELNQTQLELNNTQTDIYGTMHNSGPKDMVLDEISRGYGNPINGTENLENINEICNDPYLQQWLNQISLLPPKEFVDYVKSLGYDDESHVTLIWSMCQQKYVNEHQAQWSEDTGIKAPGDLANLFEDAINYLVTGQKTIYRDADRLARALDSYFANKRDVWVLTNKVKELDIRLQALEKTMDTIAPEAYCQGKLDMMKEYNLSGVKCGTNATMYWNAKKAGFDKYDTVAYSSCTEDWTCTEWSGCVNNVQGRYCTDNNHCGSFVSKPLVVRECKIIEQQQQQTVASPTPKEQDKELVTNLKVEKNNPISTETFSLIILLISCGFLLSVFIKIVFDLKKKNNLQEKLLCN